MQNAMVAYENALMVTSFDYYDRKNKKRVALVKEIITNGKENVTKIHENVNQLKNKLGDQQVQIYLKEYEQMRKVWGESSQKRKAASQAVADEAAQNQANASEGGPGGRKAKKGKR